MTSPATPAERLVADAVHDVRRRVLRRGYHEDVEAVVRDRTGADRSLYLRGLRLADRESSPPWRVLTGQG